MAGRLNDNWQVGKSLPQCTQHLLDNNFGDVMFRVHYKDDMGRKQAVDVTALRLLLLARSPVFFAMFSGNSAQQTNKDPIDIHDVDPQAFRHMIRFMYTDLVDLTVDNVLSIMCVAKKYIVTKLSEECAKFVEEKLPPDSAPLLLEQSMLHEEEELKEKVLCVVKDAAPAVLASEEFLHMSKEGLREVLQLDLKISDELVVFEACMKWAEHQCPQLLKKSTSGENLREVLGDNLRLIRFPTMSLEAFTEHVTPRNVLSSSEECQVFRYLTPKSTKPEHLPFHTEPRFASHNNPAASVSTTQHLPSPQAANVLATPRSVWVQGTASRTSIYLTSDFSVSTHLSCRVSRPIRLSKIFTHRGFKDGVLTVALKQNGRVIRRGHVRDPPVILAQSGNPDHHAVDGHDVYVKAGELHIQIQLSLAQESLSFRKSYVHYDSPQLSDDYITITCPDLGDNLLAGIAYSPAV